MNNAIVKIKELSVTYGATRALSQISLDINAGEVLALLGENGAGKSTLINCILGRLKANSGEITIFGASPGEQAAKQRTGTILQSANLPDNSTVAEQIELFRSYYPNAMDSAQLFQLAMLDGLQKRRLSSLSGGQKQRLFFALAVCGNPQIIFLDEPTVGLDTGARREFWQCIENLKNSGVAIVLTTHYLEEAEALADRVVLLKQGQIIHQGTPADVKAKALGKRMSFCSQGHTGQIESFFHSLNHATQSIHDLVIKNGKVTLTTATPEKLLRELLNSNFTITDLTVESARLEDAILILSDQSSSPVAKPEQAA